MDKDKRDLRKLKRDLKRDGSKHRRRQLKSDLKEDPEGAADHVENFGRYSSESLNGLDKDSTRRREPKEATGEEE